MKETIMLQIIVDGKTYTYPKGTPYRVIAADFQKDFPYDILLVNRSGKLCELHKKLDRNCTLEFLTAADKPGMQTYERSTVLLLLKSFRDVVGRDQVERIVVEFTLSHALFLRAQGNFTLDEALLSKVEARMHELVLAALPIEKRSVDTDDAVAYFQQAGMLDKAGLLRFRISSKVNTYTLDDFTDYFYGYMAPDTSYLKWFALEQFEDGFLLRLPSQQQPDAVAPFTPSYKVFEAQRSSESWSQALRISNVGDVNDLIAEGKATQMVLAQEALMEKSIGDIAAEIAGRKDVRFVMIAGPSSSGKTTFSHRLSTQLMACGLRPHAIATDNYFKNRVDSPKDENGNYNFECLEAMDVARFNEDMTRLLQGETVEIPYFNFKTGVREYKGDFLRLGPQDILVIEGIHCLNDQFSYALSADCKYKIYISCLTTLNVDDHNRISTTDARLLRRIARDARTRGFTASTTIDMWPSVRQGEEDNIFPFQDSADVVFNSALLYETALLKPYVEPLLFGIPRDNPAFQEAKRLLKFLSYCLPLPADAVPQTSLVREFIGGGYYQI